MEIEDIEADIENIRKEHAQLEGRENDTLNHIIHNSTVVHYKHKLGEKIIARVFRATVLPKMHNAFEEKVLSVSVPLVKSQPRIISSLGRPTNAMGAQ